MALVEIVAQINKPFAVVSALQSNRYVFGLDFLVFPSNTLIDSGLRRVAVALFMVLVLFSWDKKSQQVTGTRLKAFVFL